MRRTLKFLALPKSDRALLLRSLVPLAAMRFALWTMSFARVRWIARRLGGLGGGAARPERPSREKIAWAVETASRAVPRGQNCLVRALATGIVLNQFGYPNELKIGVAKPAAGGFAAHAWLESEGNVVIGDFELDRYVPLNATQAPPIAK